MVAKAWIKPLPDGKLGNVTVRQRLLESIGNMNGQDDGVTSEDLKRSGFGKVVMSLYMHPTETPHMKRQLKKLIEQWSRPIFKKEGNMKNLHSVPSARRNVNMGSYAQASSPNNNNNQQVNARLTHRTTDDLSSIISKGYQTKAGSLGNNRVRVPFSKGFRFTVQPGPKAAPEGRNRGSGGRDGPRSDLNKRMQNKSRPITKNKRSVEMSADGKGL